MNPALKSILFGLALGVSPVAACAALFYGAPYLVEGNAGTLLSFAIMALFVLSSIGVLIFAVVLMARDKASMGGAALVIQLVQWCAVFYFLMG